MLWPGTDALWRWPNSEQQGVEHRYRDQGEQRGEGEPAHDRRRHAGEEGVAEQGQHAEDGGAGSQYHRPQAADAGFHPPGSPHPP